MALVTIMDSPGWGFAGLVLAVLVLIGWVPGAVLALFLILTFFLNLIASYHTVSAEEKVK